MEDENELIALRRKKLETLRAKGIEPFGASFDVSGSIAEVREQFKEGETRHVAGRITAHRDMGKSNFLDLRDVTGRIQIYVHAMRLVRNCSTCFGCSTSAISLAWKGHVLSLKAANRQ